MITKTKLLTAVLCTFCLTAVLFSTMPVESAGTYDPWIDTNHDGRINVLDLIKVAGGIGTFGNPGLNVTVTNLPTEVDTAVWYNKHVNNTLLISEIFSVKGFAHLNFIGICYTGSDTVSIYIMGILWNPQHTNYNMVTVQTITVVGGNPNIAFSVAVPSSDFRCIAQGSSTTNHDISLNFYATWA